MNNLDEVRAAVQAQIIECLNRFYAIETGMWGGPLDALIIRTVVVGEKQKRPYDLSALAYTLGLSLTTVHRKTRALEKAGFLRHERIRRSVYLYATEKTRVDLNKSFAEMVETLQAFYSSPIPQEALKQCGASKASLTERVPRRQVFDTANAVDKPDERNADN
ncbi:TPA: helix-turn-helix domain-containing protein [Pseudomonas aeruginosa]